MKSMNLRQLPYILMIAKTGSLSAASRVLGVSQPGLSKYLSKLEHEYGLKLFESEKHHLKLTQAGALYVSYAQRIIDYQQQVYAEIERLTTKQTERLRIGMTPHQGSRLVAEIFPHLIHRFPGVIIEPKEGYTQSLYRAVEQGEVEMALTSVLHAPQHVSIYPMEREEILLCVPSFYAQAHLSSSDRKQLGTMELSEFKDNPLILMNEGTSIGDVTRDALSQAGIEPTVVFSSDNGYVVDQMIRAGSGIGFVPMHNAVPSDSVVYFHLAHPLFFDNCIITRTDMHLSQIQRFFIYLLRQNNLKMGNGIPLESEFLHALDVEFSEELSPDSKGGF